VIEYQFPNILFHQAIVSPPDTESTRPVLKAASPAHVPRSNGRSAVRRIVFRGIIKLIVVQHYEFDVTMAQPRILRRERRYAAGWLQLSPPDQS